MCRRGRSAAYPAAGSCIPAAAGANPPQACGQWPGCASSVRRLRGCGSCRCPWCVVVAAACRRRMMGEVGRVQWGSTRPSASLQGSGLQALLRRRDSVSVLESAWQTAMRSGVLNAFVGAVRATAQPCRGANGGCRRRGWPPAWMQKLQREAWAWVWAGGRRRAGSERCVGGVVGCSSRWGRRPVREKARLARQPAGRSRRKETAGLEARGHALALRMAACCVLRRRGRPVEMGSTARVLQAMVVEGMGVGRAVRGYKLPHGRR